MKKTYFRAPGRFDDLPGMVKTFDASRPLGLSAGRDLHLDEYLTNVAINYASQVMVAEQIAPIVPVEKETNAFVVYNPFEFFSIEDTIRTRGTEAKKVTRSVGSGSYQCKNYALGSDITIEDRANMDAIFRNELDAGAARFLVSKLMLDYERRVINLANLSTSVSTAFVPASSWAIQGTNAGDPISAIFQVIEQLQATTAQRPNSLLFGWRAWNFFRRNTAVRNFLRGLNNGGGTVTREMTAALFEVDNLLVSNALWHTTNEAYSNLAVGSIGLTNPIFDQVYVYYAPRAPSVSEPSWMYSFRWNNPILPSPMVVERHPYDTKKKVETIEAGYWQDERITGVAYGAKITGVTSAQAGGLL